MINNRDHSKRQAIKKKKCASEKIMISQVLYENAYVVLLNPYDMKSNSGKFKPPTRSQGGIAWLERRIVEFQLSKQE